MSAREKDLATVNGQLTMLRDQSERDEEASRAAQKHFHAVSAGLSSNAHGEDATLSEQLISTHVSALQWQYTLIYMLIYKYRKHL